MNASATPIPGLLKKVTNVEPNSLNMSPAERPVAGWSRGVRGIKRECHRPMASIANERTKNVMLHALGTSPVFISSHPASITTAPWPMIEARR